MKYRAFLSYSHADRKWARWLHRALEGYRPPQTLRSLSGQRRDRPLRPIFRDRDELPSAASLSDAVEAALRETEWLILICSPAAAASHWVNEEIRAFRAFGRAENILCFIVDGEPGAGGDQECFPPALTAPWQPGDSPVEPVAADARTQGDGRHNAMLKIAAGMLGVGFDALRQRDVQQRHRRLIAIAGGSLAVAALTLVLAITAVLARNEAQERRAQAEDLIDFMLGDLQTQLGKLGRLDVFQSVGDKALQYFAAQRDDDDSPQLLAQRARNLRQIGEVRLDYGDQDAALEAFEESLILTERLAAADPEDSEAQIALANSRFYVGYVDWQRGELAQAQAMFESVIPIVDAVSARNPDHPPWLLERGYANTNLGRVAELQGDFEAALAAYQTVMEVNERLVALEPENREWQLELGFAHNNLGKLLVALGRLDEAQGHYRLDLQVKARIFDGEPAHNWYRSYLAVSQYFLGQLLAMQGTYSEGEEHLMNARAHFTYLVEVDPERLQWGQRYANIERELGIIGTLSGDYARGRAHFESSVDALAALVEAEPPNAVWRRDWVRSLLVRADFEARHGNGGVAHEYLDRAGVEIGKLIEQEPSIVESHELAAYADICRARLGDSTTARSRYQRALATLDQHFSQSTDPRIIELRAAALTGLVDPGALAVAESLTTMGYVGIGLVSLARKDT